MATPLSDNLAWVDIVEPLAPPALFSAGQILVAIVILLGVLLLLLRWWQQQPRQRARTQLRGLLHHVDHPASDLRQMSIQLRACLCLGLRLTNLTQATVAASQQAEWQTYCDALTQLCYQPQAPTPAQLTAFIHQAKYWLRNLPTSHAH